MSCAILVLEQPWWDLHQDPSQTSVRHFLDGLARLEGLPIFYATFYDTASLGQALEYLMDARKLDEVDQLVVYIAAHGSGARLGNRRAAATNLSTVFDRIRRHGRGKVVGVLLDSCEVGGQNDIIQQGMTAAGIHWVIGYTQAMDWLTTMLINIHILSVMSGLTRKECNGRRRLRQRIQVAFAPFSPFLPMPVGEDDDESEDDDDAVLCKAVSVFVQNTLTRPERLAEEEVWPALAELDVEA